VAVVVVAGGGVALLDIVNTSVLYRVSGVIMVMGSIIYARF